jgi:hypothetical protein
VFNFRRVVVKLKICFTIVLSMMQISFIFAQNVNQIELLNQQHNNISIVQEPDKINLKMPGVFKFSVFINAGYGYNFRIETIGKYNKIESSNSFNIASEMQLLNTKEKYYFGLETRADYFSTHVNSTENFEQSSYDPNAKMRYNGLFLITKAGYFWGDVESYWRFIFTPLLFQYADISFGLGRVWYNIDKFKILPSENNPEVFDESERLHSLNSEYAFYFGLRLGREIVKNIRLNLSLNINSGLQYTKFYDGYWSGSYVQTWVEPGKHRITVKNVQLGISYKIK